MMKMGICMSNLTNLWDYRDRGMEVFPVNFPRLDGRGYTVVRLDNLNWQGVRDVFYLNIQDLLKGTKSPEEVAKAIDETCNAALEQGRPK